LHWLDGKHQPVLQAAILEGSLRNPQQRSEVVIGCQPVPEAAKCVLHTGQTFIAVVLSITATLLSLQPLLFYSPARLHHTLVKDDRLMQVQ
jgi:hypothetical protein